MKTDGNPSYFSTMTDIYRGPFNHLHSVRRGECPMYPSCSEFSRQAIEKYGVSGIALSSDRLLRCGRDTVYKLDKVDINGDIKVLDQIP